MIAVIINLHINGHGITSSGSKTTPRRKLFLYQKSHKFEHVSRTAHARPTMRGKDGGAGAVLAAECAVAIAEEIERLRRTHVGRLPRRGGVRNRGQRGGIAPQFTNLGRDRLSLA